MAKLVYLSCSEGVQSGGALCTPMVESRLSKRSNSSGFTIVELITVIMLLGILSVVAFARVVKPSAFVPSVITQALVAENRIAQQLAVSRVDANVSLLIDRLNADWRFRISTDVDGLVRTTLLDANNTTLQATSGAVSAPIDAATPLLITFSHAGDLDTIQIGAGSGDASMGVDLLLSGDSNRQACIHPTGYSTDAACS